MTLIETVAEMERRLGAGDWQAGAAFFTPDVRYRVGARPPVIGVDGIRGYMEHQAQSVRWVGHTLCWQIEEDETALIEVISHFERVGDGARIDLPCTDIYRFRNGKIHDWRVYADLAVIEAG